MSIYEPVLKFLDEVIRESKEEFIIANITVEEFCFLDHYAMSRLQKANARAEAALATKTILTSSTEEDRAKVVLQIKNLMDKETKTASYSVVGFYEKVLQILDKQPVP